MVRHNRSNAFTLLEMLIVLLILSILTFVITIPKDSLTIFMEDLKMNAIICQQKAYSEKRDVEVNFYSDRAVFDSNEFVYPTSIQCSTRSFHYNAKGNISMANSISCSNGTTTKKLVFQLGSGRVRIDE